MALKQVARFSVSYLQILDEQGEVDEKLEKELPPLEPKEWVKLYEWMSLAREADQRLLKLQRQGRMGTFPLCTGQEAAICGMTFATTEKDWFVGSYRELGGRLMRGEPLITYCRYWAGYEEGNTLPRSHRTLPVAVIIGSQFPHAVGIAHAMQYQGEKDSAVIAFIGDGGTSEGEFHEALNFAAVWKSPVVFVCMNNQWAISHPVKEQTSSETIAQKAIAYGMEGIQVDGNDPLACYLAARKALEKARSGEGPTFIEAITYRLMMHTTADDPKRYRSDDEVQSWWKKDPLPRFRNYLSKKGIWNDDLQGGLDAKLKRQIDDAISELEKDYAFKMDAPFDHIWGTSYPEIERQRAEFLHNLSREGARSHG